MITDRKRANSSNPRYGRQVVRRCEWRNRHSKHEQGIMVQGGIRMKSKLFLAAGSLGIASLSFVGVGGYAAFTDAINGSSQVTGGTFVLNVTPGPSAINCTSGGYAQNGAMFGNPGCFEGSAANGDWQWGSGYNLPKELVGNNGKDLTITVPNVSPGVSYASNFSVQDYGSLQGIVTNVNYAAAPTSALSAGTMIYFYQAVQSYQVYPNGTIYGTKNCVNVNDSTTPSPIAGARCLVGSTHASTGSYVPTTTTYYELLGATVANGNASFKVIEGFVQPWRNTQSSDLKQPGSEAGPTFKVIVGVHDATGNGAENQTMTPTFSVLGETLP